MESTRTQVLQLIIERGRVSVAEISGALGVTQGALRRHLDRLRADGLIRVEQLHQDMGRPLYLFSPTEEAETRQAHYGRLSERFVREITVIAPEQVAGLDGRSLVSAALQGVGRRVVEEHRAEVAAANPDRRVVELTKALREEGILSGWERESDGYRLINAACPYRKVAHATEMATCSMDAQVIQELLGLPVEQVARLVDGEVRCEYLVRVPISNEITAPQAAQTGVTTG